MNRGDLALPVRGFCLRACAVRRSRLFISNLLPLRIPSLYSCCSDSFVHRSKARLVESVFSVARAIYSTKFRARNINYWRTGLVSTMTSSMLVNPIDVTASLKTKTLRGFTSRRSSFLPWRESSGRRFLFYAPILASGLSLKDEDCRIPILHSYSAAGKDSYGEDQEPFWLTLAKDIVWSTRFLISFLVEQPGQLKYIEWPSFQSTLKTAMLTLVLVAALIVALSSVDSVLCYVLALVLRRSV